MGNGDVALYLTTQGFQHTSSHLAFTIARWVGGADLTVLTPAEHPEGKEANWLASS